MPRNESEGIAGLYICPGHSNAAIGHSWVGVELVASRAISASPSAGLSNLDCSFRSS